MFFADKIFAMNDVVTSSEEFLRGSDCVRCTLISFFSGICILFGWAPVLVLVLLLVFVTVLM